MLVYTCPFETDFLWTIKLKRCYNEEKEGEGMKKRIMILLSLIIAVVFTGGTVWASYASPSSWPTSVLNSVFFNADLVIEGTILDDGAQGMMTTNFAVSVDEVWFGSCDRDEIILHCALKYTLPRKNDKVILLLREDSKNEGRYYLTSAENGIFIKNPPFDLLFPLSPVEDCMIYDGKSPWVLKSALKKALRRLERKGVDINCANGDIAVSYRKKYLAKHPEEEEIYLYPALLFSVDFLRRAVCLHRRG